MPATILRPSRAAIPMLTIVDGYYVEKFTNAYKVTAYPVETGSRISDHVVAENKVIEMKGWISNIHPLGAVGPSLADRAREGWSQIEDMASAKELFTIYGRHGTYDSCVITKAEKESNAKTGLGLRFTLILQQVQIASAVTTLDTGRLNQGFLSSIGMTPVAPDFGGIA